MGNEILKLEDQWHNRESFITKADKQLKEWASSKEPVSGKQLELRGMKTLVEKEKQINEIWLSGKNTDNDHRQADAIVKEGDEEIPIQITRALNKDEGQYEKIIDKAIRDSNIHSITLPTSIRKKKEGHSDKNWKQPQGEKYYEICSKGHAVVLEKEQERLATRCYESFLKKKKM